MAFRVLFPLVLLAALGGCASLGEPARDADGCIPGMAVYQPGVGPGRAGMVIHIPRSCPPPRADMTGLGAMLKALEEAREAERGPAPPPVSAPTAIRQGLRTLCGRYFASEPYSLEALRQAAFDAGYRRTAPVPFFPSPGMERETLFSAAAFTASIADPPSPGHGVAAFVSAENRTCQLQIYGYAAEGEAAVRSLVEDGWRPVGEAATGDGGSPARRYYGVLDGRPVTMVATRVTPEGDGPGLEMVLNLLPGEDAEGGLLADPPLDPGP